MSNITITSLPDRIVLDLDGAEAHVIAAAISAYRKLLQRTTSDFEAVLGPIAERAEAKLADAMYPGEDLAAGDFYAWPA